MRQLWHLGKQARDGVSFGMSDGVFKHPACDLGGLTNYKQPLGAPADFAASGLLWPDAGSALGSREVAEVLHARWGALTGKVPAASFKEEERPHATEDAR